MNHCRDEIPAIGMMGIVMHKMMNRAQEMYQEFDLNKSQAGVLLPCTGVIPCPRRNWRQGSM